MATTEATHYFLGYVSTGGRVIRAEQLEATGPLPRYWGARLRRFWPTNRPGRLNDPWNERSSVGRGRASVSLAVTPLLRQFDDLVASGMAVFDVNTHGGSEGRFAPVDLDTLLPAKVRGTDGLLVQA